MPKTTTERVRAYRLRQRAAGTTPRAVLSKVRKFLNVHPDKCQAVDAFMKSLAMKVKKTSVEAVTAKPHWLVTEDDRD
jgi:hypothetical protein